MSGGNADRLRGVAGDLLEEVVRLKEALRVARGAFQAILDCEEVDFWIEEAERVAAVAIEDIDAALEGRTE